MDSLWIENIEVLFSGDKLKEYLPNKKMSEHEKVNALMRLSIYYSIIMYIIKDDMQYFYIPLLTGLVTYFIYHMNTVNKRVDIIDDSYIEIYPKKVNYKRPTKNNPFMNLNPTDYGTGKVSKPALRGKQSNKVISNHFDKLYKDVDDLHEKDSFLRQYYTMPVSTVPDNRLKFAKWCYKPRKTSKHSAHNNIYSPLNNALHR